MKCHIKLGKRDLRKPQGSPLQEHSIFPKRKVPASSQIVQSFKNLRDAKPNLICKSSSDWIVNSGGSRSHFSISKSKRYDEDCILPSKAWYGQGHLIHHSHNTPIHLPDIFFSVLKCYTWHNKLLLVKLWHTPYEQNIPISITSNLRNLLNLLLARGRNKEHSWTSVEDDMIRVNFELAQMQGDQNFPGHLFSVSVIFGGNVNISAGSIFSKEFFLFSFTSKSRVWDITSKYFYFLRLWI